MHPQPEPHAGKSNAKGNVDGGGADADADDDYNDQTGLDDDGSTPQPDTGLVVGVVVGVLVLLLALLVLFCSFYNPTDSNVDKEQNPGGHAAANPTYDDAVRGFENRIEDGTGRAVSNAAYQTCNARFVPADAEDYVEAPAAASAAAAYSGYEAPTGGAAGDGYLSIGNVAVRESAAPSEVIYAIPMAEDDDDAATSTAGATRFPANARVPNPMYRSADLGIPDVPLVPNMLYVGGGPPALIAQPGMGGGGSSTAANSGQVIYAVPIANDDDDAANNDVAGTSLVGTSGAITVDENNPYDAWGQQTELAAAGDGAGYELPAILSTSEL